MKKTDCPIFQRTGPRTCNAPLCPLETTTAYLYWLPDEEICRNGRVSHGVRWIKQQKRLKARVTDRRRYFTIKMLKHTYRALAGTRGIDPDTAHPREAEEAYCRQRGDVEEKVARARERGQAQVEALQS